MFTAKQKQLQRWKPWLDEVEKGRVAYYSIPEGEQYKTQHIGVLFRKSSRFAILLESISKMVKQQTKKDTKAVSIRLYRKERDLFKHYLAKNGYWKMKGLILQINDSQEKANEVYDKLSEYIKMLLSKKIISFPMTTIFFVDTIFGETYVEAQSAPKPARFKGHKKPGGPQEIQIFS